jgi:hypothetical protein
VIIAEFMETSSQSSVEIPSATIMLQTYLKTSREQLNSTLKTIEALLIEPGSSPALCASVVKCILGISRDIDCLNDQVAAHIRTVRNGEVLERMCLSPSLMQKAIQYAIWFNQLEASIISEDAFIIV